MSDNYNAVVVVFESDISDEGIETLLDTIKFLRYVLSVTPNVSDINSHIAYERARRDLRDKLWDVLNE